LILGGVMFEGNMSGKINLHGNIFSCFIDSVNVKARIQTNTELPCSSEISSFCLALMNTG